MKKWYLLNLLAFLATLATGQDIEFDTLNTPFFISTTDDFFLNSQGHIFKKDLQHSTDNGLIWKEPDWGQPKTTNVSHSIYKEIGVHLLKFNIEDYSIDTLEYFDSFERGGGFAIGDGVGNSFVSSSYNHIYNLLVGDSTWRLIQENETYFSNLVAFPNSEYLFYSSGGTNYRCNKIDGSEEIVVDKIPSFQFPSGKFLSVLANEYYYSEDEGLTWISYQNLPIPTSEISFFDCHSSGKMIILNKDSLVFISEDFGQSWLTKSTPIPEIDFNYLDIAKINYSQKSDEYFMIASANFNTNFFKLSADFDSFTPIYTALQPRGKGHVREDFNGNFYLGTAAFHNMPTFYRSKDQGKNFLPYTINSEKNIGYIVPLRKTPTLFANSGNTFFRSLDAGENWDTVRISGNNIQIGYNDEINIIDLDRTNHFSNDNGENWESINKDLSFKKDGNYYQVSYLPDNRFQLLKYETLTQNWITLGTIENKTINTNFKDLFISERGTIFWSTKSLFIYQQSFSIESAIHISYDGGISFSLYEELKSSDLTTSNFSSYKDKLMERNSTYGLEISDDEGLTWAEFLPNFLGTKTISSSGVIYVRNNGKIMRAKKSINDFNALKGRVFLDENKNCEEDTGEIAIPNSIIKLSEGTNTQYTSSNKRGDFAFYAPTGNYTLSTTYNSNLFEACDSILPISFSGTNDEQKIDLPLKVNKVCPDLKVSLATPILRRCFSNSHYIQVENNGTIAADSVYVELSIDDRFQVDTASIPWTKNAEGNYHFFIGTLDLFEKENFHFITSHSCDSVQLSETICMEVKVFPEDNCGSIPEWSGATINIDAHCNGDSLYFKVKNVGNEDMLQPRQYIIIEDVAIMRIGDPFQLPSGSELNIPVEATGQTVHFEIPQIEGHPNSSNPSFTIEACGSEMPTFGLFNQFSQNDGTPNFDIECQEIRGSYDPNDKSAVPIGIDVEHKIQPKNTIDYMIRFQNTGTDSAFTVIIVDTLSQFLDITSFEAGASSHPYEYEISGQGTVRFIFNNIMLPDSNINEVESNGFIKYKIAMKTDIPLGTEILNEAYIYFDFNDPIRTNQTFHVVDEPWVLVKTQEIFQIGVAVNVFPNPFHEQATIEIMNASVGQKRFNFYSLSGKLIMTQMFDNERFTFQRDDLPKGIYFYKIKHKGMNVVTGKLVIL